MRTSFRFVHRKKALKGKFARRQTRKGKCRNRCNGTGNRGYGNAARGTKSHHILAGVADSRRARIGDERTALATFKTRGDLLASLALVVLKIGNHRFGNAQMREQSHRIARILSGNKIHLREHLNSSLRKVCQISNRRGNQIKRACEHAIFFFCTVFKIFYRTHKLPHLSFSRVQHILFVIKSKRISFSVASLPCNSCEINIYTATNSKTRMKSGIRMINENTVRTF